MKTKIYSLFAQIETVEDVAEVIAATHAILTTGVTPALYEGNRVSRDLDKPFFGGQTSINTNPHMGLSFGVELAGAGAVDAVAGYDALLRVCGLTPSVNAGSNVTYNLQTNAIKTLTAYFLRGTQLYQATGVRGNMAIELNANAIPKFMFDKFLGTYYTPSTVAEINPDYSDFQVPESVTKENTTAISIDGFDACFSKFSLNLNNVVTRRSIPGCRKTIIGDRDAKGQVTVLAPDLATKNFFAALESHAGITQLPIHVAHGTAAGRIVDITAGQAQITKISETDVDGDLAYQMDYSAVPSDAGNDDFVLVTK